MNYMLRLYLFEFLHGNRIAVQELIKLFGFRTAFRMVLELKLRLWFFNPFAKLNQDKAPTAEEKASQHQMAPALVLFDLMIENGIDEQDAIDKLQNLIITVATAFLKFNVPVIRLSDYHARSNQQRMDFFKTITSRFFNAEGQLSSNNQGKMYFQVNKCLFAQYSKKLGYQQLAKVFCSADKHFFELHQPNIQFGRTVTLAEHQTPCDFSFTVRLEQ